MEILIVEDKIDLFRVIGLVLELQGGEGLLERG